MFSPFFVTKLCSLYRHGKPLWTDAVLETAIKGIQPKNGPLPRFSVESSAQMTRLSLPLKAADKVFGLGQMLGSLNKRGKRYRLFAKDDPSHASEKSSLYGSHPFCIFQGQDTFGIFIDYPSEIIFDVGFTDKDILQIEIPSANFDLYLFEHWDIREIIREYLKLTGTPYLPPRWAFGYQQCRYSYPDATTLEHVANKFRELDIPCGAIYMDIDYMQEYKIFTVDEKKFPKLPSLVDRLGKKGFQVIPIIDPGVKVESGYEAYETGAEQEAFCVKKNGEPFTGAVWPGLVHFPDFLNKRTRTWWGSLYKPLTEIGLHHFWNDMSEPAIFYTPESLERLRPLLEQIKHNDDLGTGAVDFLMKLGSLWQNEEDLRGFFHTLDDGTKVCHWDVRNLYGFNMAKATAEGLEKLLPNQRYFLVARSSYSGMQRFAVIWTGDNTSWWEHMLVQMRMVMSLNMAGFFYCGGDVGGFGGDASAELCVRWTQLGCFTPLFRNHSTKGSRSQEPWAFDLESQNIMRDFIRLRYALIPYSYSEFFRCTEELSPFISPMFLHFGDPNVKEIEDQFMYGYSLMVAPIHSQNATSRFVYLPECRWLHWNVSRWDDRSMAILKPGIHLIHAKLNQLPIFIRENSLVVMTEPMSYVGERAEKVLHVVGFVTHHAEFTLIHDDGISNDYKSGGLSKLKFSVTAKGKSFEFYTERFEAAEVPLPYESVHFEIYDQNGENHQFDLAVSALNG